MPIQHRLPSLSSAIVSREHAIAAFQRTMSQPVKPETLVLFLEHDLSCRSAVSVSGTLKPEAIIDVAETVAAAAASQPHLGSLVLASIRPDGGIGPHDDELWFDINDIADDAGIALVDWLIFGRFGIFSPPELLGLVSRWAA